MKRVFIVHGWGGHPGECWFPWLKQELEARKYVVQILTMPNTNHPTIQEWIAYLQQQVKKPDQDTYFVGHSIGCQTIMRYLEQITEKIGGAVFVGGFFHLTGLTTDEEQAIAKPWIETPIDLDKVKQTTKHFVAILSDNDPFVPLTNQDIFKKKLGATIIIEKNKGHLNDESNTKQLPSALHALLTICR